MQLRAILVALALGAAACEQAEDDDLSDPHMLVGQWMGVYPVGSEVDALSVDDDGTGVADLYFIKGGALWTVQLQFEATAREGWFDCSFTCAPDDLGEDDGCLDYEFEARCSVTEDYGLRCSPAPGWYPRWLIELERPID